ncbi:NAD(P)/FAD-dependent oxidoreductase [Chryseobacterium indologenes]|uniref:NAD(P)/FAD-dependent oxidoreductase n=1 Tax=Chryseobacterium indologenes TaxID=253 RepID=UPI000F50BE81|nr:NAD(P)/FAD-dependent oxidoreductase [Chryseobacterium indologenes]AYZ37749.1 NAD(P)/FAD-dependent oxidoreductase [Chryseobacterium indologenes]MBF6646645.1 NAD(P)/FAD-dependent oxidoreductase [Chryseobacterium indologenes]MBU3047858.1 NAD(P)/FAD-dependent oxidoreductase [Chryseobacterium indologenes]MEB4760494.1 NAD(P)/FAD-dependent oxidoreductase [Chryseobacterium indologenes]QQQ69694.1 NAD(P)/FAD-dependent oxidoreductase [Chryseobacterium indologenes]
MKQIIIIGGGAAGFFCAANLDEKKYSITILEQNSDVLQKVKISGGGRCNVTHACFDPRELVQFYPRGNKELLSVFTKFQPGDTMEWFDNRNVPLKIENDNRTFPESNSSQTIINTFLSETQKKNVVVKTKCTVKEIEKQDEKYLVKTNSGDFEADFVVYTTGSSPKSLKIVQNLGHKIVDLVPSLFTFNIKDELLKDLPGTSFENAWISIPKLKTEESGPLLITHWGLSGPAVLKISAWEAISLAQLKYNFEIEVNFISVPTDEAEEIFQDFKQNNPKKSIGQSKIFDITNRFWQKILEISKVDLNKQVANISGKEMQKIIETLCKKKFRVTGKSTFKDEFVTAGGVDLKEINFKNMSSKLLPNFYIAGEVLNIDAVTGGFNFQACWSEGWLIAQHLNSL